MTRFPLLFTAIVRAIRTTSVRCASANLAWERPHVVLIFADDMGKH